MAACYPLLWRFGRGRAHAGFSWLPGLLKPALFFTTRELRETMKVFALIKKLFGGNRIEANGTGSGVSRVIPSPCCPECKALIVFSHQVLLDG